MVATRMEPGQFLQACDGRLEACDLPPGLSLLLPLKRLPSGEGSRSRLSPAVACGGEMDRCSLALPGTPAPLHCDAESFSGLRVGLTDFREVLCLLPWSSLPHRTSAACSGMYFTAKGSWGPPRVCCRGELNRRRTFAACGRVSFMCCKRLGLVEARFANSVLVAGTGPGVVLNELSAAFECEARCLAWSYTAFAAFITLAPEALEFELAWRLERPCNSMSWSVCMLSRLYMSTVLRLGVRVEVLASLGWLLRPSRDVGPAVGPEPAAMLRARSSAALAEWIRLMGNSEVASASAMPWDTCNTWPTTEDKASFGKRFSRSGCSCAASVRGASLRSSSVRPLNDLQSEELPLLVRSWYVPRPSVSPPSLFKRRSSKAHIASIRTMMPLWSSRMPFKVSLMCSLTASVTKSWHCCAMLEATAASATDAEAEPALSSASGSGGSCGGAGTPPPCASGRGRGTASGPKAAAAPNES
mmetsp:Transcript_38143/g.118483  ORF Transcript_38143/g.118483 Transcript_38143/m.118483 type:complete len:472 (-) Transcript_38143:151-1566(-)